MSEPAAMTTVVDNVGGVAGFLMRTARGWRAFTTHKASLTDVALGNEHEIGTFPSAAEAREAILQHGGDA